MRRFNIGYFFVEGFQSIFTHGLMSFAAVCMIICCLLIMGSFSVAVNLDNMLGDFEKQNEFLAYIDETYTEEQARALEEQILAIPNVASAEFMSRGQAKEEFAAKQEETELFESLPDTVLRDRFRIHVNDLNQLRQTVEQVKGITGVAETSAAYEVAEGFTVVRNVASGVAVILVAENLGHLKAVAGMTGRNMDPYMGRAFVGDGLATMLSGSVGGSGVTTYAENIGVMAVTKVYSTLVFVAAAVIAMLLGFSPKFGALIHTIPAAVIGGASIVVFGLIAVAGARIWVQNRVDLSQNGNLIMVAVTLVLGAGDFALTLGGFTLGGIGTATFGAILLNALLSRRLVDVPPPEVVHQEP